MSRLALILAGVVMLAVGVAAGADTSCPVGVVDFPRLQKDLGVSFQAQVFLNQANADLTEKLNKALAPKGEAQAACQRAIGEAVRKVQATQPNADQKTLLADPEVLAAVKKNDAITLEINQLRSQYQVALNRYAQTLETSWQGSIKPALVAVCKERGMKVIFAKAAAAFVADEVDVTNEVSAYYKDHPLPTFTPPPAEWEIK